MSEIDNAPISNWDIPNYNITDYDSIKNFADKYLNPYMKNIKECKGDRIKCTGKQTYYMNGDSFTNESRYYMILNNQIIMTPSILANRKIISLNVDINGPQKLNTYGKDTFSINIVLEPINSLDGNIKTRGVYLEGNGLPREQLLYGHNGGPACSKDKSIAYAGMYCGGLIMLDGWKISNDYPW